MQMLTILAAAARHSSGGPAAPAPLVINGHRALLLSPRREPSRPPLVLLGGTAQWLDSWVGHLSALAQKRRVLLYETRGQAGGLAEAGSRQSNLQDCSLQQHAKDFCDVLHASGLQSSPEEPLVDVVAFSFGARVAMAAAAFEMPPIRRLCLTGVAAERGARGRLTLESWRASLAAGDLEGFAWRMMLDTHSAGYLEACKRLAIPPRCWCDSFTSHPCPCPRPQARERHIGAMVRAVTDANSLAGLRAIVDITHTEDPSDPTHPLAMAHSIRAAARLESGLLVVGEDDILSPAAAAKTLAAEAGGWGYCSIAGAAHAVPIEQSVAWRRAVLSFLDET